jgi:hypothetical protein
MKTIAVMLIILLAGDLALFSGAYSRHAWASARHELKSIQSYADEKTGSLTRG